MSSKFVSFFGTALTIQGPLHVHANSRTSLLMSIKKLAGVWVGIGVALNPHINLGEELTSFLLNIELLLHGRCLNPFT